MNTEGESNGGRHASGRSTCRLIAAFAAALLSACGQSGSATPARQATAPPATSPPVVERQAAAPTATHDLSIDEAMGGHTLQRHVGKTDAELKSRLEREPQISAASTYTDRASAERVVGAALQSANRAFDAWRERRGRRPNFVLRYRADRVIGRSLARGQATSVPCERALIVLRWDDRRRRDFVLTSYPEEGR
jgi:hypothetical protein